MKTKHNVKALVSKQVGKDAIIILNKIEKMLKRGVARVKIEKALAAELSANAKKQVKLVGHEIIFCLGQ